MLYTVYMECVRRQVILVPTIGVSVQKVGTAMCNHKNSRRNFFFRILRMKLKILCVTIA